MAHEGGYMAHGSHDEDFYHCFCRSGNGEAWRRIGCPRHDGVRARERVQMEMEAVKVKVDGVAAAAAALGEPLGPIGLWF